MDTPAQGRVYCSDISQQAGEVLFATATPTSSFILLEYNGAWGEKALEQSALPEAVKNSLIAMQKGDRELKVLMLRRGRGEPGAGYRLFVATTIPERPALYSFRLGQYEDLLSLNLPAMLAGDGRYQVYCIEGPLFLVCTNGRRDACCTRKGIPVFETLVAALGDQVGERVWQCSHIGGHRFAANLIDLPSGLLYGRVDRESARLILQHEQRQEMFLPNLRGRMCYSPPAQAAEYFLRQQTGQARLDAFQLLKAHQLTPERWEVVFIDQSQRYFNLIVRAEKPDIQVFDSCQLDKQASPTHYLLESLS